MKPPLISWGLMLQDTANYSVIGTYPWDLGAASAFVLVTVCAFYAVRRRACATQSILIEVVQMALALANCFAPPVRHRPCRPHRKSPIIDARNVAVSFKVEDGFGGGREGYLVPALPRRDDRDRRRVRYPGKSVTARTVMGLLSKRAVVSPRSTVAYDGANILKFSERARRRQLRGDRISMIFQEPMSSLNPIYTVGSQIVEAIRVHRRKLEPAAGRRRGRWSLLKANVRISRSRKPGCGNIRISCRAASASA